MRSAHLVASGNAKGFVPRQFSFLVIQRSKRALARTQRIIHAPFLVLFFYLISMFSFSYKTIDVESKKIKVWRFLWA